MLDWLLGLSWLLSLLLMAALGGLAGYSAAWSQIRQTLRTAGGTVCEAMASLRGAHE